MKTRTIHRLALSSAAERRPWRALLLASIAANSVLFGCKGGDTQATQEAAVQGRDLASENAKSAHGSAAEAESTAGEVELPSELQVSADLIESGRISLVAAQTVFSGGGRRVPGEVVSAPDGAAEVGVLIAGRIAALQVNVGDRVKKGAVLAWVESPEVGAARAELASASARVEMENARMQRQQTLQEQGATSASQVESAKAAQRAAESERTAAALRLSALGASAGSGARYSLTSPIDGVVTSRTAVLGSAVRPESTLFSIIAPERILVLARYPEGQQEVPQEGSTVRLTPRGASALNACSARVETRADVVDPHTRTVLVRLQPGDDCQGLRPGAYVEVNSQAPKQPTSAPSEVTDGTHGVQIPAQAVVYVRGRETVFVAADSPGKFIARRVRLNSLDGDWAVVAEGVKSGERVVERGTILLKGEMMRDVLGGE